MDQLTKLIEQYEKENPGFKAKYEFNELEHWRDLFIKWLANEIEKLALRPTCGVEQRIFLDEVEKLKLDPDGDLEINQGRRIFYIKQTSFKSNLSKVNNGE